VGIVDSTGRHNAEELYDYGESGKYMGRDDRLGEGNNGTRSTGCMPTG